MIKAITFDLDDTLFDSTGMAKQARWEACEAMINAGLPAKSVEEAYNNLKKIVKKYGSNYTKHYNVLCRHYGIKPRPEILAAGMVAYHNTKFGHLHLFPKTHNNLLKLIRMGYKIGILTRGNGIKQWDKIIRLNLQSYFDLILVSDKRTSKNKGELFIQALKQLKLNPNEIMHVGDRPDRDVFFANKYGFVSVLFQHGPYSKKLPRNRLQVPKYKIKNLSELFDILQKTKNI